MRDDEILNLLNEAIATLERLRDGVRGVKPPSPPPTKPLPFGEKKDA